MELTKVNSLFSVSLINKIAAKAINDIMCYYAVLGRQFRAEICKQRAQQKISGCRSAAAGDDKRAGFSLA